MGRVEVSRSIRAPLAKAFELIANGDHAPEWHQSIVEARHLTAPPIQVGSRLHLKAQVGRRSFEWTQEVTEWKPTRSFRDRLVPGTGPFAAFEDWGHFEMDGEKVRVTFGVDYRLRGGPFGWLLDRLVVLPRLRPEMEGSLAKAAEILER